MDDLAPQIDPSSGTSAFQKPVIESQTVPVGFSGINTSEPQAYPDYQPATPPVPVSTAPKKSPLEFIITVLIFIVLFAVGVVGSMAFRAYMSLKSNSNSTTDSMPVPLPTEASLYTETPIEQPMASPTADIYVESTSESAQIDFIPTPQVKKIEWEIYGFISPTSGELLQNISFKLPPEVKKLECDKPNCISQGTYLPGGTRFTVAVRGENQMLRDFREGRISDASGASLSTTPVSVGGLEGVTYKGDFTGKTINNVRFGKIRGVMLAYTDSISLEMNHFAPVGKKSDYSADDLLFDKILASLTIDSQISNQMNYDLVDANEESNDDSTGQYCGGERNVVCPANYKCILENVISNASGTCVKDDSATTK